MIISAVFATIQLHAESAVFYEKDRLIPVIIAPHRSSRVLQPAINDLKHYLGLMTGRKIEIADNAAAGQFPVYIGNVRQNNYLKEIAPAMKQGIDGFVLDIKPDGIHIFSSRDRGAGNGIYELLERLGCRWLFAGRYGEVVPRLREQIILTVGQTIDRPAFSIREMYMAWGRERHDWFRRTRQGVCGFNGHNSLGMWQYRDTNPDWFAEINGSRTVDPKRSSTFKLCYANDEMVKQATAYVLDHIAKLKTDRSWAEDSFIYSVSPTDGGGFCKCEACRKQGSISDQLQLFANKIGAAVGGKYPDISVGYYGAYSEHQEPPRIKADDDVFVFMTSWNKVLDEPLSSLTNKVFREKVEEFLEVCPTIAIRDYDFLTCWWFESPYSLIDVHQQDCNWYLEKGVKGIATECSDYWEGGAQSNYVTVKLWWNPKADVEELKRDFVHHAYGKAFEPMWRFHEHINKGKVFLEDAVICRMRHELEEAAKLADREDTRKRIDLLRIHYLALQACSEIQTLRPDPELITTALRAELSCMDAWSATVRRRVMLILYRALQELPDNQEMKKIAYPVTGNDETILKAMASAGITPFSTEELKNVLDGIKIPEAKPQLPRWPDTNDLKLVPLNKESGTFDERIAVAPRYLDHELLIYAAPNEKIEITTLGRHAKLPVIYRITSPEMLEVDTGSFSEENPLSYTAGSGGIYKINLVTRGYPALKIKNRYVVFKASSINQRLHPFGGLRNHYFYVPAGTQEFSLVIKGEEPYKFALWDCPDPVRNQKPLHSTELLDNKSYLEHRIQVPAGSDGRIWKMNLNGEDMELFISGIPPFISSSPLRLLSMPEENMAGEK
jgi:hypothetical protein